MKKTIALLTSVIFLTASVVWAQPVSTSPLASESDFQIPLPQPIKIPEELGTIQEEYRASGESPFIIYIQDAHAVWDAQRNIQSLIAYFQEKLGVRLIGVEGAQGPLDPTLFRTFPDEWVKKKIFSEYLMRGEASGADMAAIFPAKNLELQNPHGIAKTPVFYGIEDWNLYEANYLAYLRAVQMKDKLLERLKEVKRGFDEDRRRIYPAQLSEFHEKVESFQEEQSHLLELVRFLAVREYLPKDGRFPHLAMLFESAAKESAKKEESLTVSIHKMGDVFKKKFAEKLSKEQQMEFHEKYQAYVTGQMEAGTFLKFMVQIGKSVGMKPRLTPTMRRLLDHAETLSTIKGTKLLEELQNLLLEIEQRLTTKPEERELAKKYKQLLLLKDLTNLELTRDQLEAYQKGPEEYLSLLGESRGLLVPALEFYRVALERDRVFLKSLSDLLAKENARSAVVVAGGFHAKGFERNLKKEGYSYILVTPKIRSLEGQETYREVMQGKLSYKPYLRTTYYDAFARHSTVKLVEGLNEPDFRKNMKLWRDNLIRSLAKERRLTQAGEYTRYTDLLLKTYYDKFSAAISGGGEGKMTASREEILEAIEQELDKVRDDSVTNLWRRFQFQLKEFTSGLRLLLERKALTVENVSALLDRIEQTKSFTLAVFDPLAKGNKVIDTTKLWEGESAGLPQSRLKFFSKKRIFLPPGFI